MDWEAFMCFDYYGRCRQCLKRASCAALSFVCCQFLVYPFSLRYCHHHRRNVPHELPIEEGKTPITQPNPPISTLSRTPSPKMKMDIPPPSFYKFALQSQTKFPPPASLLGRGCACVAIPGEPAT